MRIVVVRGTSLVFVRGRWSFAVVMGGLRGCWAVDVVRWVLAVVHCSLSALRVVVNWAVAVVVSGRPGSFVLGLRDVAAGDVEGALVVVDAGDMGM